MEPAPRVAIAHDYLTQRGGAERVVLALARAFPGARIYTTLYDPDATYPEFADLEVVVSPLNRSARLRRDHRLALPLLAPAARRICSGLTDAGLRWVYRHATLLVAPSLEDRG